MNTDSYVDKQLRNFTATNPKGPKNLTDIWLTPPWIIEKIGPFNLDPCAFLPDGKSIIPIADNYFTEEDNGLLRSWVKYPFVFVNFPYSQARDWLKKCKEESLNCQIVVLCFARTETKAWQDNVKYATGINFINRRISFLNFEGKQMTNGNAPSCLIAFGSQAYERIKKVDGIIVKVQI